MSDTNNDDDVGKSNSSIVITSGPSSGSGFKRKLTTENLSVKRIKNTDNDDNALSNNTLIIESNTTKNVPLYGTPVDRRQFRRAGPYLIGPKLGYSPVDSIVQYLAKKENTDEFVQLKILMLSADTNDNNVNTEAIIPSQINDEKFLQDERQGKMLLHTEFSLLSLLQDQVGVIHHRGMFSVRNN